MFNEHDLDTLQTIRDNVGIDLGEKLMEHLSVRFFAIFQDVNLEDEFLKIIDDQYHESIHLS